MAVVPLGRVTPELFDGSSVEFAGIELLDIEVLTGNAAEVPKGGDEVAAPVPVPPLAVELKAGYGAEVLGPDDEFEVVPMLPVSWLEEPGAAKECDVEEVVDAFSLDIELVSRLAETGAERETASEVAADDEARAEAFAVVVIEALITEESCAEGEVDNPTVVELLITEVEVRAK